MQADDIDRVVVFNFDPLTLWHDTGQVGLLPQIPIII